MRRLSWFALGFSLACLIFCYLGFTPLLCCLCVLLLGISLGLWCWARPKKGEYPPAALSRRVRRCAFHGSRRVGAACLGTMIACLWCVGYEALFVSPAAQLADSTQTISGCVISYPVQTSLDGYSATVRLDGDFCRADVLFYGNESWGSLQPGDRITCTAEFQPARCLYGSETTYYTAKGVYLLAYTDEAPLSVSHETPSLSLLPTICAHRLKTGIYAVLDQACAPLAAAITLGDKTGLSPQLSAALSRSGLMHAAVVSGMHISFLVTVILFLSGGRRKVALCLVPLLFFYALMAGAAPSAVRAVIMAAAAMAGPVLGREPDSPSALSFALLVLLIQNPFAAASVSLQMSFCAVAGILLVAPGLRTAMLRPVSRMLSADRLSARFLLFLCRAVLTIISVSMGAMLFTLPLSWIYFRQIVLAAPLACILTMWAVTVLMVGTLIVGSLAVLFPAAMAVPGAVLSLAAQYIIRVANWIGRLPLSSLNGSNPCFALWLAAAYLFILSIALSRRRVRQTTISLISLSLLLALAVGINALSVHRDDLTVVALDVGQGSSTLFLSDGHAALVDCGGNADSSAGDIAADTLAAIGKTSLDALVFTHLDDDHCNGIPRLFQRLRVAAVYIPDTVLNADNLPTLVSLAEEEGIRIYCISRAYCIPLGEATLTLYPPLSNISSNEAGLFALCSRGEFDVLVTGDASAAMERSMIRTYPIPDLEVLMVSHHGSAGSTCAELLDGLHPDLAVISVGYNHYGQPSQEVLERLTAAHAEIYRTDLYGPVTIGLRGNMITMK